MDNVVLKNLVKTLRNGGKTYSEILDITKQKIPKSTLAYWCKGLSLPDNYYSKIKQLNKYYLVESRKKALEVNKAKQQNIIQKLYHQNRYLLNKIDNDIQKIILAILYLGEGSKWRGTKYLGLGNADPNLIKYYLKLLRSCYQIEEKKLKCRVSYRADQNITELQNFWAEITKIPLCNFYKTKYDVRTIGKEKTRINYKGVCVIYYFDTRIQLELETIANILINGPVV
ncbi:hypothetical protein A3J77_00625 [Candidatus Wolfebacteria bacterium RBG_13_41_7]|uniref:Uncharacterized protein n=1 Tax=Candidatus Wolfebacteria bacterium RBG_13_41_7 TaxID=1802554 RepID=A0A1F8DL80_9BACT|nr:MAG: hypothetical protein A3J77_00625 [Candidatus Wolfebacteria bacterium RBG_13_41_7]